MWLKFCPPDETQRQLAPFHRLGAVDPNWLWASGIIRLQIDASLPPRIVRRSDSLLRYRRICPSNSSSGALGSAKRSSQMRFRFRGVHLHDRGARRERCACTKLGAGGELRKNRGGRIPRSVLHKHGAEFVMPLRSLRAPNSIEGAFRDGGTSKGSEKSRIGPMFDLRLGSSGARRVAAR